MKNMEKATHLLIMNGYDEEIAKQLPKLFISDYFEKGLERISESFDLFIDLVQGGSKTPNQNNKVKFALIKKMSEDDMDSKSVNGLFYNFRSNLKEEFFSKIKRRPLKNILENNGAFSNDDGYLHYFVPIVEKPQEYQDLCAVILCIESVETVYIKIKDLYELLKYKGFDEKTITLILGEYGNGLRYPRTVPDEGIYINYDAIMNLGNFKNVTTHKLK